MRKVLLHFFSNSYKNLVAGVVLLAVLSAAHALSLGKLTVLSKLGAPLRAEIELRNLSPEEESALTAKIPNAETFKMAGLEFNPSIGQIRVDVAGLGSEQSRLVLSSTSALQEPLLDVLVELNWSTGRIVREYSILLDPTDLDEKLVAVDESAATIAIASPVPAQPNVAIASSTETISQPSTDTAATSTSVSEPNKDLNKEPNKESNNSSSLYMVKSGDTLYSIASSLSRNKPSELSLLLAAVYKQNPEAFISGDANKIKAGAVISLPPNTNAADIKTDSNKLEFKTNNFNQYRQKVASNTLEKKPAPANTKRDNIKKGAVVAKVTETVQVDTQKDQLKVAGSAQVLNKQAGAPKQNVVPESKVKAESVEAKIAKERALKEEKGRADILAKNVANLKKALEVKNDKLSTVSAPVSASETAQKEANKPVAISPLPTPQIKAPESKVVEEVKPGVASAVVAPPVQLPATVIPSKPSESVTKALPAVDKDVMPTTTDVFDLLINLDPLTTLGIGLVLVLAGGLILYKNRNGGMSRDYLDSAIKADGVPNSLLAGDGGHAVDTDHSAFSTSFAPANVGIDAAEVDPLAEADVYIQYGREAHAVEILKDALAQDPGKLPIRLKLMEAYAKLKNTSELEKQAKEIKKITNGNGPSWRQAQEIGLSADSKNPLYGGSSNQNSIISTFQSTAFSVPSLNQPVNTPTSIGKVDFTTPTAIADVPVQSNAQTKPVSSLDALSFATTMPTVDLKRKPGGNTTVPSALNVALDFDVSAPPSTKPIKNVSSSSKVGFDGSALDFSADNKATAKTGMEQKHKVNSISSDQEFNTKLNLAEAYAEIGDKEGARELLQEMIASGNEVAISKAKAMLNKL